MGRNVDHYQIPERSPERELIRQDETTINVRELQKVIFSQLV